MEFYKNCSKKKLDQSDKRKWCIVIDYHRLNDGTLSDKYPLSQLYKLLDKLGRARPFTISDLETRFFQIEIKYRWYSEKRLLQFKWILRNHSNAFQIKGWFSNFIELGRAFYMNLIMKFISHT